MKNWKLIPSKTYPHMAKIETPNGLSTLFDKADAQLMIAAPDLLEALENLLRQTANSDITHPAWRKARTDAATALAKATGTT